VYLALPASRTRETRSAPVADSDRRFDYLRISEPAVGIEPTTARLRIGCSTTELRWRAAGEPTEGCPGADSNRDAFRHHPLKMACLPISPPGPNESGMRHRTSIPAWAGESRFAIPYVRTGLTGLEPATSGVTDRHSNQAELQPPDVPSTSATCAVPNASRRDARVA
jgi:hypothetical protein